MSEPRLIFLGALDVSQDEAVTINIPPDADAETIRAAVFKANAERQAETKALRELTGLDKEPPR